MNIFVSVVCSVLISTAFFVVLLLLVRKRLGRQFAEIERRLVQVERTVYAVKFGQDNAVVEQLGQLHRGLVRLHETTASRYGSLVPLAEEMREDKAEQRRFLPEHAILRLERWGREVSAPVSRGTIVRLAREVARIDGDAEAPDFVALLAAIIALRGDCKGNLVVACDATLPEWLLRVLKNASTLGPIELGAPGASAHVCLFAGSAPAGRHEGIPVLVSLNPAASEGQPPPVLTGCDILAAGSGVVVYKKGR